MSDIARNVYSSARRDREADSPTVACTYTNAINTVRRAPSVILKNRFLTLFGCRFNSRKHSWALQSLCGRPVLP
jgi:hypothetical protein